jgi:MSHA biogenesis protein MshQ
MCYREIKERMRSIFILLLMALVLVLAGVNEAQAAITYFSSASNPADNATLAASPVAVTPPVSMATGDLVILVANTRTAGITPAISVTGGQAWTSQTANTTNGSQRIFWARYNGTWSANPSVSFSTSVNTTVVMHVFRPTSGINTWAIDVAQTNASFAAPGGSNDVTVTGITTVTDGALVFATWASTDNNSWVLQTAGWSNAGTTQYRNSADSDSSQSSAYLIMPTAGPSGSVVNRQTVNGGDAGNTSVLAFREVSPYPLVSSINRASTDPTETGLSVSWTVVFSASVTGVDATDFALVQAGGVSGASITSVTGSGTTWTVTANTGSGTGTLGLNLVDNDSIIDAGSVPLGGAGAGNGNFTGQVYTVSPPFCTPPSNIPAGVSVSCVCDQFGRASLNPSTIFGANWIVSTSDSTGKVPSIVNPGYLRLTNNTGDNAKAATVPGIFPAAGNYISVEFQDYAYSGSGADGIAVTLSDYAVTAVPGAFGGSLGYAQKTPPAVTSNVPGFAGGWIGVGLDEFGNYQNPTEGRIGGPGVRVDSVGVRGSGSGVTGYNWMAGTTTLAPGIDNAGSATPAPGYYYQVIVDARNDPTSTSVAVNRDTGAGYTSLITIPNVYTAATAQGFTQAPVPINWQISFTGSTGGSTNVHEIGGLRICAQNVAPPSGGTASGFNAIDEAYGTPPSGPAVQSFLNGHIYMKVAGSPFKLNVAALNNNQILTTYAASSSKSVTVKLVDNTDGACVLDSTQANYCSATCTAKTAVTGGSQTLTFVSGDSGKKQSTNFTLNTAYKNLAAVISDGTTTACSTDAFSVRPASIASVTSSNATNTGTGGTPIFKAGADTFSLTATTTGIAGNPSGYTGALKINSNTSGAVVALSPATILGAIAPLTFPAATSGTPSSTATGNNFTYSEVGGFYFRGYNPATDATSSRGIYDGVDTANECAALTAAQCDVLRAATWVGVDSITSKGDCVQSNFSNTKDANGKYGCSFGLVSDSTGIGRFTPAYFDVTRVNGCTGGAAFTYSGQSFTVTATARNAAGAITQNYHGAYGLSKDVTISDAGTDSNFTPNHNTSSNNLLAAGNFVNGVRTQSTVTYTFPVVSPPKETVPATVTLRAIDTDGVSSSGHTEEQAEIRSGRLHLYNAYGSELLDLFMPMRVEYWSADGWVANTADTCSSVGLSALGSFQGNLNAGETCVQDTGNPGVSGQGCAVAGPLAPVNERYLTLSSGGDFNLYLRAPGATNDGSADVTANLATKPWLRFDWNGAGDVDPTARATFGLYRGSPRHIYMRERY